MPRIFLPLIETSGTITITGEKARYLSTVLRCKEGDELIIFDARGVSHKAIIKGIAKREVLAEVTEVLTSDTESSLTLILVQGLLKGEKMELVIQKTTELGVKEILPAITERSQVRETRKIARWRKIAEDASRQSGRTCVPVIHNPMPFAHIFAHPSYACGPGISPGGGLIFWEKGGNKIVDALATVKRGNSCVIAIGPEGGFTGEEVAIANSGGLRITTLGNRILRAETAAVAATAILQFHAGDLG
ncbi:MAG TPA: 16S rRNA (uracil(1498)-N(3))-methyltransferase [Nitrospiraceae bacterium]|nr:16S rRNA (uracil(1498)-N(3))-methyltransferase [Nitrospiraceae bacterium]